MLFPIVVLLGLNGLVVGILNAHDHFTIPAIAPLVWNLVIIAGMVGLAPLFEGAGPALRLRDRRRRGHGRAAADDAARRCGGSASRCSASGCRKRGDERVRRVLMLMLPVSVGLGLININLLLNSTIGSLVSDQAPRAIDAAFRIYMLPQGMFRVAVATVLFPQLAGWPRAATTPACGRLHRRRHAPDRAAADPGRRRRCSCWPTPIVRLVYQRGEFDAESTELTAEALFWFAFSLPFSGCEPAAHAHVLLAPAPVAADDAGGRLARRSTPSSRYALYKPLGIARHRARHGRSPTPR